MDLKDLVDKYDKGNFEVEFATEYMKASGFFVEMRPMDRDLEQEFNRKCKRLTFDPKTHQRVEDFDNEKFANLADEKFILGWRGLTPKIINILIPTVAVASDVPQDEEIPCTPEAKRILMARSKDFAQFILSVVVDASKVKANIAENEEKNSLTSHDGNSQDAGFRAKNAAPRGATTK